MNKLVLTPLPISAENFSPYGDVIELQQDTELSAVAEFENANGTAIKVIKANQVKYPFTVPLFERHPLGTQAFIPINEGIFFVVVAEKTATDSFNPQTLKCFITNGKQGIQYHRNTWHAPFSTLSQDALFTMIERHPNSDENQDININFARFDDLKIVVE